MTSTGSRTTVNVKGNRKITDADCVLCGQCITHCPVGGLQEHDDTGKVFDALADPNKITVVQMAPAVRVAWAEYYHLTPEFASAERMVTALKQMGFDYVFDTNFTADLTIMEEGSEFVDRFTHRERYTWPMFTSCCPGWVRFLKGQFPDYTDNLSTAKSPQQMFGALAKSYFAEKIGVDPKRIFVVSIMPCTAKKSEAALPTMRTISDDPDVDVVLTTREIVRMFRGEQINPATMEETPFDSPLGTGTGAAVIFGASGGVMDAALRSAYYLVTGSNPDPDAFSAIRGVKGWKEATFTIPKVGDLSVAISWRSWPVPAAVPAAAGSPSTTARRWPRPVETFCGASTRSPRCGSPMRIRRSRPCIGSTCVPPSAAVRTTCSIRITRAGKCPTRSKT